VTSRNKAEKAWSLQVKKHPDLFADLTLTVQRAVIKDRGTYYRVQAGPFSKREAADSLCRKLKKLGQDCLVIRP
jgi:cell division protein FtsN